MTTAIAVAAVLAFSFALGSMVRYVDGPTLRRWRLSRRWDVSRLAREFITAADEPLATLRGLTHMINAWERGARRPSERYWLLYLRVFPECANAETVNGDQDEARELVGAAQINASETANFSSAPSADPDTTRSADPETINALAATVRDLEQQIAGLSRRLDKLSGNLHEAQRRERSDRGKARSKYLRSSWAPLWTALLPSSQP
jgi:hypothetical protein